MTYSEKLKDPRWQKKRLQILKRDRFKCRYCGDKQTELQIHHLKYSGEPWEADNENLITTCKHCHNLLTFLDFKILKVKKDKAGIDDYKFVILGEFLDGTTGVIFSCYMNNKFVSFMGYDFKQFSKVLKFIDK